MSLSGDPLSSELYLQHSVLRPLAPIHTSDSIQLYEAFSALGMLVIPTVLHLYMQFPLSVSIWMSNTHPNSTHVKPPLQLLSQICCLPSVPSQIRAVHSNSFLLVAPPPDLGDLCDSPLPLFPHSFSLPCIHYAQRLLILPSKCIQNPIHSHHLHPKP